MLFTDLGAVLSGPAADLPEQPEYYQGGRAYLDGECRDNCPYLILSRGAVHRDPDMVKARAWCRGFDAAWRINLEERNARLRAAPHFPGPHFPQVDNPP